jgi:hypothetical protein
LLPKYDVAMRILDRVAALLRERGTGPLPTPAGAAPVG